MSTPFKQPAKNSGFFSPRDHADWLGRLFLIYPDRIVTKTFQADEGPVDMVEADVAIIDLMDPQTGQPTVLAGTTIGGKALVPQLKTQLGAMVLGRLAQSPAQGQKSGAYYLTDFSDQDAAAAQQYIQTHPRQQFAQPQAQQAPAANVAQGQAYAQQQYGQAPAQAPYGAPQAQPQYASQALPYDPWAGTQASPTGPGAPGGAGSPGIPQPATASPPQGQWGAPPPQAQAAPQPGAWGQPAGNGQAPAAAPAAGPQPSATGNPPLDPQLVAFLQSKGVPNVESMSDGQARMIAATFQQ